VHELSGSLNDPRPRMLKLRFDAAHTHLFDPATGMRLAPPGAPTPSPARPQTEAAARLVAG
jgi:hypothetical protein